MARSRTRTAKDDASASSSATSLADMLRARLVFDVDSFDTEVQEHAELEWHAGQALEDAKRVLHDHKDEMGILHGKLIDAALEHMDKPAQWKAEQAVACHPEYAAARETYRVLTENVGRAQVLFDAYRSRGYQLSGFARVLQARILREGSDTI